MKFKMDAKVKDRSIVVIRCGGRGQTDEESRAQDLYPSSILNLHRVKLTQSCGFQIDKPTFENSKETFPLKNSLVLYYTVHTEN